MGSFFAGIKAGTLSGVVYLGGLAVFNVLVLYAFKTETLGALSSSFSQYCTTTGPINSTISGTPEDCFTSVVTVLVPTAAFLGFFIALLYAGILGRYFESLPGSRSVVRGEIVAAAVGLNLLFFGLAGDYFTYTAGLLMNAFLLGWTVLYGFLLGRLYRRYTRVVKFESQDGKLLRVMVDGRDHTGKSWTFAATSNHKVKAEVSEDASFIEWEPTGGISLEDPRSFETVMEVSGEGALTGKVSPKY